MDVRDARSREVTSAGEHESALPTLRDLGDPTKYHEPIALGTRREKQLRSFLERMKLIRRVEEVIGDLVTSGVVRCPCHLAIGQEACAVGVASALDVSRDRLFGAHRSHGHYLAIGASVEGLLAEVLGRRTGCSGGMGGSMHLIAPELGLLGTVPIVGATVPMAVGAALAARMDETGGVATVFFGDGATEEGVVQESLNFAASYPLPVLFACENNLFSSHLHIRLRQPSDSVARYARAHGVAWETIDGNDVVAVADAAERAVTRARASGRPTFLEMVTYRWRGHVGPRDDVDVGVKRTGDLSHWKKRDPIRRLTEAMLSAQLLDGGELDAIELSIEREVSAALETAQAAPYPDLRAPTQYLYSDSST
jgi:TPP-dependent pyruvate/acetoin dehydrogenase alpha subunit